MLNSVLLLKFSHDTETTGFLMSDLLSTWSRRKLLKPTYYSHANLEVASK